MTAYGVLVAVSGVSVAVSVYFSFFRQRSPYAEAIAMAAMAVCTVVLGIASLISLNRFTLAMQFWLVFVMGRWVGTTTTLLKQDRKNKEWEAEGL